LTSALDRALQPDAIARAQATAAAVRTDWANVAARRLISLDSEKTA
jgi:vancomycin aglycone glucosyltransferase